MRVRRLTWAGVEIRTATGTLLIDPLLGRPELSLWAGDPQEDLLPPSVAAVDAVAVTHLHSDHFDAERLPGILSPGAAVMCPAAGADDVTDAGFEANGLEPWETASVAGFELTAVPAVDGFGSPQVSWVVSADDARLVHCGDTLWHGYWWEIAERYGPLDMAFLPINGAVAIFDYLQPPSGLPAVMTPDQAAAAAHVLGAPAAPIHYGTFHKPPTYVSVEDPEATFRAAAESRGVVVRHLSPGDELELRAQAQPR